MYRLVTLIMNMGLFSKSKTFPDSLSKAVFTTSYVIHFHSPITLVSHELDGDWQFTGDEPINDYKKIAKVVSLGEIIKLDKSVLKIADLPKGYQAARKNKNDKWEIIKIDYSDEDIAEMGFICSSCGELHKEIPMAYVSDAPYFYFQIPEEQLDTRVQLTKDTCIIDDKLFYIKGQLNIAVDDNDVFNWVVWVSISEADYDKAIEMWDEENRFLAPPYDGKMATKLDCYPDTLNLVVKVYTQEIGIVPKIQLMETSNPIFLEQESGIDMKRVVSFARKLIYKH